MCVCVFSNIFLFLPLLSEVVLCVFLFVSAHCAALNQHTQHRLAHLKICVAANYIMYGHGLNALQHMSRVGQVSEHVPVTLVPSYTC